MLLVLLLLSILSHITTSYTNTYTYTYAAAATYTHVSEESTPKQNPNDPTSSSLSPSTDDDDTLLTAYLMQSENIYQLNDGNLHDFLSEHPHVVINYYSDMCAHCVAFKPIFHSAALQYYTLYPNSDVYFAAVNGQLNPSITEESQIKMYPTVLYYKNGQPLTEQTFNEERTLKNLLRWIHSVRYDLQRMMDHDVTSASASTPIATSSDVNVATTTVGSSKHTIPSHSTSLNDIITPSLIYALHNLDYEDDETVQQLAQELQQIPIRLLTAYPMMILTVVWLSGCTSGILLYGIYTYYQQQRRRIQQQQRQVQPHLHVQ